MTKVDTTWLRALQRKGWQISDVTEVDAAVGCPREGCGLTVRLHPDGALPSPCRGGLALPEYVLTDFDSGRIPLRERREGLSLSIVDVEECAGIATDHLRKFERDNPTRIPNIVTFLEWAQTLGFDVVLRPSDLPPITLARISETRDRIQFRKKRNAQMKDRR